MIPFHCGGELVAKAHQEGIPGEVWNFLLKCKIFRDQRGQDLVEYALMTGFVALMAAAAWPQIGYGIWYTMLKVWATLDCAGGDSLGGCEFITGGNGPTPVN